MDRKRLLITCSVLILLFGASLFLFIGPNNENKKESKKVTSVDANSSASEASPVSVPVVDANSSASTVQVNSLHNWVSQLQQILDAYSGASVNTN